MSFFARILTLTTFVAICACSMQHAVVQNPVADYPYRHYNFDYKVAWKTVATDKGILVEGVLKDVRFYFLENIDLTVRLLDKDDRVKAVAIDYPFPMPMEMNQSRPFSILLEKSSMVKGDKLQFLILSAVNSGSRARNNWLSEFTVDAATGKVIGGEKNENKTPDW